VDKPTDKAIRQQITHLGITPEVAGRSIDQIVREAREQSDPFAWLEVLSLTGGGATATQDADVSESADAGVGAGTEDGATIEQETVQPEAEKKARVRTLALKVPRSDRSFARCYISDHVETRLTRDEGLALRALLDGLQERGEKLADGSAVKTAPKAIRWLLQQIA
jgi:hypothetical protein